MQQQQRANERKPLLTTQAKASAGVWRWRVQHDGGWHQVGVVVAALVFMCFGVHHTFPPRQSMHQAQQQHQGQQESHTSATNITECDLSARLHTGYIQLAHQPQETHYFYTLVESAGNPATDPLLLWLRGGGANASEDLAGSVTAMLQENGPCLYDPATDTFRANPFAWSTNASVAQFPQFGGHDLVVAGDGYAGGQVIPALAHRFAGAGDAGDDDVRMPVKLRGIAIGNALVDPVVQVKSNHRATDVYLSSFSNGFPAVFPCRRLDSQSARGQRIQQQ